MYKLVLVALSILALSCRNYSEKVSKDSEEGKSSPQLVDSKVSERQSTIIDSIQKIVETEMDRLINDPNIKPQACYAIMADPKSGAILALAERFKNQSALNMKSFSYDPGSLMKPISIAGALEYNSGLNMNSKVNCENGLWFYGGHPLRDGHKNGIMNIKEVVQKSSNIGTAKVALTIKSKLHNLYRDFGFGEVTGVFPEQEHSGIISPEENWTKVSYSRIPIGQGISVTAPQILQAYCTLANEGKMMQLRLTKSNNNINSRQVISKKNAEEITDALISCTMRGGIAAKAKFNSDGEEVLKYPVAGMAGTVQKIKFKKDRNRAYYSNVHYVSSFIGYLPANNPKFVLYIIVDEPQYKRPYYYGATAAAPSFRRISLQAMQELKIFH